MDPNLLFALEIIGLPNSDKFTNKIMQFSDEINICISYAPTGISHYPASYLPFLKPVDAEWMNWELSRAQLLDHINTHLGQFHVLLYMKQNNCFNEM